MRIDMQEMVAMVEEEEPMIVVEGVIDLSWLLRLLGLTMRRSLAVVAMAVVVMILGQVGVRASRGFQVVLGPVEGLGCLVVLEDLGRYFLGRTEPILKWLSVVLASCICGVWILFGCMELGSISCLHSVMKRETFILSVRS